MPSTVATAASTASSAVPSAVANSAFVGTSPTAVRIELVSVVSSARVKNRVVGTKSSYLQLRVSEDIKDDLQRLAKWHGLSVSALIHSTLVRYIREEKEREPRAFAKHSNISTPALTKTLPAQRLDPDVSEVKKKVTK